MKRSTKISLALAPALSILALGALWLYLVKPWVLEKIKAQVPKLNEMQKIATISVEDIDFSLLKLQMTAAQVKVSLQTKNELNIPHIKLQIDPFNLLIGQLEISYIKLDQAQIDLDESLFKKSAKKKASDTDDLDLNELFVWLPKIPVNKIIFNQSHLNLNLSQLSLNSDIKLLTLQNRKQSLYLNATADQNSLTFATEQKNTVRNTVQSFGLNISTELKLNELRIINLKAFHQKSYYQLTGDVSNLKKITTQPNYSFKVNSVLIFDDLKALTLLLLPDEQRPPQILGELKIIGDIKGSGFKSNFGTFDFKTTQFQFNFIKFGNADIKTKLKNNLLTFDLIELDHPSARIKLTGFEITQEQPFQFKSKIQIDNFNLQRLFSSLDLKNIPADFNASLIADCKGQATPLEADCDLKAILDDISLFDSRSPKKNYVFVKKGLLSSNLNLNSEKVTYTAQAKIKNSEFTSSGTVVFKKGFDLKFNSGGLDLADIENLLDLNFKGKVSGDLFTSGDSNHGLISTKIKALDFGLDKFRLGDLTADTTYAKGVLNLDNINGSVDGTLYQGHLGLNFNESTTVGDIQLNPLFGKSLLTILNDRFNLPFNLTGSGQGHVNFAGPLAFWKLHYSAQADLNQGVFFDESFKTLNLNIESTGDKIDFKKALLKKPSGQISAIGEIDTKNFPSTDPVFNIEVKSQNLKLEEIDHINQLFPKSTGVVNLNLKATQPLEHVQIAGLVSLKDMTIEADRLPPSQGEITLNKNFFKFNGQILGRQIQTQFQVPFTPQQDFLCKTQMRDFNPLILLPLIKIPIPSSDTISLISADLDLKSSKSDYSDLKGFLKLNNFLLQRSAQSLKLQQPSEFIFNGGLKSVSPLVLKGSDQLLLISQSDKILNFNGKLSLRPFQFLVPFVDNMNGQLDFNFGLNLSSTKLSLAGSGLLQNGFLQLHGFPYPIKDLSTTIDFSQTKLILTDLQATLNQSPLIGFGALNFIASKNIELNIQAESPHVDLEFPEKIQTSGPLKLKLYGPYIPYTLKVDYVIDQGLVTKEFSSDEGSQQSLISPSRFLPLQQLNQQAPSLLFDIDTKFSKGILIKNQLLEGVATGYLKIAGSPEAPLMSGRIDIQQGSKLIFKDKPMDIQTGYAIFNPDSSNPTEINPEVFINANARVTDYDVNLLISGSAKNLNIKPSSQPPLSQTDIFSLLALGFTSAKQDQSLTSDTQSKQTGLEVIAALSNQSKINKEIQQKLGLNVQLSPSVDSTKNIAVPKVVVSRKLGKKINASYARPLTGNQQGNEVKLQWLFHPDFSLNLNYQNQSETDDTNIIQKNTNDQGNYGFDLEYKKEFK